MEDDDRPAAQPPAAKYAVKQLKTFKYKKASARASLQCSVCQCAPATHALS